VSRKNRQQAQKSRSVDNTLINRQRGVTRRR